MQERHGYLKDMARIALKVMFNVVRIQRSSNTISSKRSKQHFGQTKFYIQGEGLFIFKFDVDDSVIWTNFQSEIYITQ